MDITLKGQTISGKYTAQNYFRGVVFEYSIFIPYIAEGCDECALLVECDGLNKAEAFAMQTLAENGEAPAFIVIGIVSGTLHSTVDGGYNRGVRLLNYDLFTSEYPDFLVNEIIPNLITEHSLKISPNADMHMISGGSSGGIASWNAAWFRNDYFRRVQMSSPSFLAMGKGRDLPDLVRKFETKPIRVATDYSEDEPNEYFGSSFCAADEIERALRYAGYDMLALYHPGEGHCSRYGDVETIITKFRFLWKNWDREPVSAKKLSCRAEKLISLDMPWEECSCPFPEKARAVSSGKFTAEGEYTADGGKIFFVTPNGEKKLAADGFDRITALTISSDRWRLYVSDLGKGCVYSMTIMPDGSLNGKFYHGLLHFYPDFKYTGATDITTDSTDRTYAATEMGIQAIRSFGLIDVIIPLPDRLIPELVEIDENGYLWAKSGNRVFRRKLLSGIRTSPDVQIQPAAASYYD